MPAPKNQSPASPPDIDAEIFASGGICLRGRRAQRFMDALYEVAHAVDSLEASVPLLVSVGPGPGEIDVRYAVKSFSEYTGRRLTLLMNAVINEDLLSDPLPPEDGRADEKDQHGSAKP